MVDILIDHSLFFGSFLFLIGACLGSFANVVIYRMPMGQSVVLPRSHCTQCNKLIPWYDNLPIVSWFILRGRCRSCGAKFSIRYALVELLMGILFTALFYYVGPSWLLLEYLIFTFGLVTVSFIDFDHMILPDEFTLGGILIGLLGAWLNPERSFTPALFGVLLGGGFLWAIAAIYMAIRKQEGMGGGDIKLLAWIGAVLGWQSIPFVILSASFIGTFVGLFTMMRTKGDLKTAIPFGPYLALGALIYILGGSELGLQYIHLFLPSLSPAN